MAGHVFGKGPSFPSTLITEPLLSWHTVFLSVAWCSRVVAM